MFDSFSEWCAAQVRDGGVPSLSVAVGVGNEIVFAEAYGFADVEERRPATPETAFLLASVTKPMTAVAICLLANRKQLSLDEPVEAYLAGLCFNCLAGRGEPTVRHVLQHTSGLGGHFEFFYVDTDGPRPSFEQTIERYGTLYANPGEIFTYSNLGYGVLDEVIRNVIGGEPEAFVREEVFLPLGMTTAHIGAAYPEGEGKAARRYSADVQSIPVYDSPHRGAGSAWMSASDLVRFGCARTGGTSVLSAELTAKMVSDSVSHAVEGSGYALGWQVWEEQGHEFVGHSGGSPGVSAWLCIVPAAGVVLAVLCNQRSARGRISDLGNAAIGHLLETLIPGFTPSEKPPPAVDKRPSIEPGLWSGHALTYAGEIPLQLRCDDTTHVSASVAGSDFVEGRIDDPGAELSWPVDFALSAPLQLPTPDALVRSPELHLMLRQDGDRLTGFAMARPRSKWTPELGLSFDSDWGGAGRLGNLYSHWCELKRER